MQKNSSRLRIALAALLTVPLLAACDGEMSAERAGRNVDNATQNAADSTGKALENVGEAIQDKSREVSREMSR